MSESLQEQLSRKFRRYITDEREQALMVWTIAKERGYFPALGRKRNAAGEVVSYCVQMWGNADEVHQCSMAAYDRRFHIGAYRPPCAPATEPLQVMSEEENRKRRELALNPGHFRINEGAPIQ